AVAVCHLRMRDLHLLRPAIRIRTITPVSVRWFPLLTIRFWHRALWIAEYGTGLLRLRPWQKPLRQRMQCGFELLAVGLTQRSALGAIDDPVQFCHIHINAPARNFFFIPGSVSHGSEESTDSPALPSEIDSAACWWNLCRALWSCRAASSWRRDNTCRGNGLDR